MLHSHYQYPRGFARRQSAASAKVVNARTQHQWRVSVQEAVVQGPSSAHQNAAEVKTLPSRRRIRELRDLRGVLNHRQARMTEAEVEHSVMLVMRLLNNYQRKQQEARRDHRRSLCLLGKSLDAVDAAVYRPEDTQPRRLREPLNEARQELAKDNSFALYAETARHVINRILALSGSLSELSSANAIAFAHLIYIMGMVDYRLDPSMKPKLDDALLCCHDVLSDLSHTAFSRLLHGLGRLQHHPPETWMQDAAQECANRTHKLGTYTTVTLLQGLSMLGGSLPQGCMLEATKRIQPHLAWLTPRQQAELLHAVATLKHQPQASWLKDFEQRSSGKLSGVTMKDASLMAVALQRLRYVPSKWWTKKFLAYTRQAMQWGSPGDILDTATAVSRLNIEPSRAWLHHALMAIRGLPPPLPRTRPRLAKTLPLTFKERSGVRKAWRRLSITRTVSQTPSLYIKQGPMATIPSIGVHPVTVSQHEGGLQVVSTTATDAQELSRAAVNAANSLLAESSEDIHKLDQASQLPGAGPSFTASTTPIGSGLVGLRGSMSQGAARTPAPRVIQTGSGIQMLAAPPRRAAAVQPTTDHDASTTSVPVSQQEVVNPQVHGTPGGSALGRLPDSSDVQPAGQILETGTESRTDVGDARQSTSSSESYNKESKPRPYTLTPQQTLQALYVVAKCRDNPAVRRHVKWAQIGLSRLLADPHALTDNAWTKPWKRGKQKHTVSKVSTSDRKNPSTKSNLSQQRQQSKTLAPEAKSAPASQQSSKQHNTQPGSTSAAAAVALNTQQAQVAISAHDIPRLTHQQVVDFLYACAELRMKPDAFQAQQLLAAGYTVLPDLSPSQIAATMVCVAVLKLQPSKRWSRAVFRRVYILARRFSSQELANTLIAAAYLQIDPGPQLQSLLLSDILATYDLVQLAMMVRKLSEASVTQTAPWLTTILQSARARLSGTVVSASTTRQAIRTRR